jgi:hypothetical protein
MKANSVDSDQYVDGSIDRVHLASDVVDGTKIADDSIDSEHYVDGSIDAAHINTTDPVFNVQTNGNVGIGLTTTSVAPKLAVRLADDTSYINEAVEYEDSVIGVINTPTEEAVNNHSSLHFNLNAGEHNHVASISLVSESDNVRRGALTFCTDNGTTRPEAMRIDSAGKVGIGTTSPSAPLEISSTTGGVIMPRMTTTERDAISSPTDGEMIYNTTTNKFQGRANGAWVDLH